VRIAFRSAFVVTVPVRPGSVVRFEYRDVGGERWVQPSPVEMLTADELARRASPRPPPSLGNFARAQVAAEVLLGAQLAFVECPDSADWVVRVDVQPGLALTVPLRPGPALRAVFKVRGKAAVCHPTGTRDH
jgi:hypothetical protein